MNRLQCPSTTGFIMASSDLFEKAPQLISKIQKFLFSILHLNIFLIIYRFNVGTVQENQTVDDTKDHNNVTNIYSKARIATKIYLSLL